MATAHPASANDKHAALIVDANNGQVMHAEQADETRFPASLTKIMTLYMAFEAIQQGRASYATRIKVSQEAASQPPTKLDLEAGETIALIDAMKGLITKSANDAAVAIAEHLGGTETRFAKMMTDKARLFGMSRTTFRNASGLPDPGQVTTARDLIRLALRIQDDFPKHYQLFATRSFSYDGATYRNHNNLLFRFQGTDGIKTGYTRASGFNLVSSVRRGGRHVVGIVLGGRTPGQRDVKMQLLVSRALLTSSPYKTRRSAPVLVAAAAPAQRPQPRPAPAPVPVAAVPPAPAPSPPPTAAPVPKAWATASAAGTPAVQPVTERPRPVMVPARQREVTPVVDGSATWPSVPAPVPAVRPQVARADAAATDNNTRLAFTPRGFNLASARELPAPAPAATGEPPGSAPSTLQQQAIALTGAPKAAVPVTAASPTQGQAAGGVASTDARVPPSGRQLPQPHAVGGPLAATGGFEIQVGAFATPAEAERAMTDVRARAGELLRGKETRAIRVSKEARQVYRARFVGFDSRTAASTCLEMRRRQIDCFVMRAE